MMRDAKYRRIRYHNGYIASPDPRGAAQNGADSVAQMSGLDWVVRQ
jgi:hypothetical protein